MWIRYSQATVGRIKDKKHRLENPRTIKMKTRATKEHLENPRVPGQDQAGP